MPDHDQRTVHSIADHVRLSQQRGHVVRVLDADGAERRVRGRPVNRLHRRGVRAKAQRRAHVSDERVLLRWLVAVHGHIRHHHGMEADRTHWHIDPDSHRRHTVYGSINI